VKLHHRDIFILYMIICGDKKIDLSSLRKTFADWSRAVRRSDDLMRAPHVLPRKAYSYNFEGAPGCYFKKLVTHEIASN